MLLSVASRNPDGLSEAQIKKMSKEETVPAGKYRPKRRNELTATEQEEILDAYMQSHLTQSEIARRYRVTTRLVCNLYRESKKKPQKLRDAKEHEKQAE